MDENARSSSPSPSPPPKRFYTYAALDKPPILRRNAEGMFMTTQQIEDDDARILREEKARPPSRPPINKDESVFPASGWPTGPKSQEQDDEDNIKIIYPAPIRLPQLSSRPIPFPRRDAMQPRAPPGWETPVPSRIHSSWSSSDPGPTPDPRNINSALRAMFPFPEDIPATPNDWDVPLDYGVSDDASFYDETDNAEAYDNEMNNDEAFHNEVDNDEVSPNEVDDDRTPLIGASFNEVSDNEDAPHNEDGPDNNAPDNQDALADAAEDASLSETDTSNHATLFQTDHGLYVFIPHPGEHYDEARDGLLHHLDPRRRSSSSSTSFMTQVDFFPPGPPTPVWEEPPPPYSGPVGVYYNPANTGLVSAFSSSSSGGTQDLQWVEGTSVAGFGPGTGDDRGYEGGDEREDEARMYEDAVRGFEANEDD